MLKKKKGEKGKKSKSCSLSFLYVIARASRQSTLCVIAGKAWQSHTEKGARPLFSHFFHNISSVTISTVCLLLTSIIQLIKVSIIMLAIPN